MHTLPLGSKKQKRGKRLVRQICSSEENGDSSRER
jgi:hypothetical protein